MKYLSDYTEKPIKEALAKAGAFYAFGDKQFSDQAKEEDRPYVNLGNGLICPMKNADSLITETNKIIDDCIQQDLKDHSKASIIERELINYECYYTGDYEEIVEKLKPYNITEEEIENTYNLTAHKYNY